MSDNTASRLNDLLEKEEVLEDGFQNVLRPRLLGDYVGQKRVCDNLSIAISATKNRAEPLDHVLLYGPPGLGKTTLAYLIAKELGVSIKMTSGPVLERPGDLAAILSGLAKGDVLFVDEIHRMPRIVEEILYPAMEDFKIDIIVGQGPAARSIQLEIQPFTLVGATTRSGFLTAPLRDRFGIVERVEFYPREDLVKIVKRSSQILNVRVEDDGAEEIAKRSRGTPRIANRLLKRVRDYAQEKANGVISKEIADFALDMLGVDVLGLNQLDRLVMLSIIDSFRGGPVGLDTIAASVHEERETVEDVCEPYLLQIGFLKRTPRGREATPSAFKHFGKFHPINKFE